MNPGRSCARCWWPSCRSNNRTTEVPDEACGGDETCFATRGAAGPLPYRAGHRSTAAKTPARQAQRGRPSGRCAASGRGRMRSRGASGGGTLCSGPPQLPQFSCGAVSTRSQWPRAGHPGFKHCTVQPDNVCIVSPRCQQGGTAERRASAAEILPAPLLENAPKNWRDCAPTALGVSIEIDTISGGTLPAGENPVWSACRRDADRSRCWLDPRCVQPGKCNGERFNTECAEGTEALRSLSGLGRCATASSRPLNCPESFMRRGSSALFASRTAVAGRFLGTRGFSPGVTGVCSHGAFAPDARCGCARNF